MAARALTEWLPTLTGILFAIAALLAFAGALSAAREADADERRRRGGGAVAPSAQRRLAVLRAGSRRPPLPIGRGERPHRW